MQWIQRFDVSVVLINIAEKRELLRHVVIELNFV